MKELTIEQKVKRYDEISKEVKDFFDGKQMMYSDVEQTLNYLFPELKESEDERIRRAIIRIFTGESNYTSKEDANKYIAWLKKQESVGEIVERCKNSWYNEGKIAGQFEGITDDEKYQQGWHDALEKQGKKPTWSEDDERIITALMEGFRYHQLFNPTFGEVPNAEIISWIKSLKERVKNE